MKGPNHRIILTLAAIGLVVAIAGGAGVAVADPAQSESNKRLFTDDFAIEQCSFANEDTVLSAGNPLFPLVPGQQRILEGEDAGAEVLLQITTCYDDGSNCSTNDGTPVPGVRSIAALGVDARVVEEREYEDGELIEVSHNYFARCEQNNAVFYFGEAVEIVEDGVVVDNAGAWEAGVDDARPGVVMPGLFLLGARYYQEVAPDVALDRGENAELGLEVELDLAADGPVTLEGCVLVFETTELASSDRSTKIYCPGVGLVIDDVVELTDKNF